MDNFWLQCLRILAAFCLHTVSTSALTSRQLICYTGQTDGKESINTTLTGQSTAPSCIIFAERDNSTTSVYVSVKYSFDTEGLCKGRREGLEMKVRVADVLGDLYCCSEDRCNSADRLRVNLTSDHTCFIGTAVMNGTRPYKIQGMLSVCKDQACLYERQFHGALDPNFVIYRCDSSEYCSHINNTCQNITDKTGAVIDRCCCTASACNKPQTILPPAHMLPSSEPSHMVPMPPGAMPHHFLYITGGVVVGVLCCILISVIVVVVIRFIQHRQQQQFSYIYSQLTADLCEDADDKEEDARMLVA